MWPERYYNLVNARMRSPTSSRITLKTQKRVWDILVWDEKIGSWGRSTIWTWEARSWNRKYTWAIKSYNREAVNKLDQWSITPEELVINGEFVQKALRKVWVPTIPTFRWVDGWNALMTDLTEWWKKYVIALNDSYGNKLPYFNSRVKKLWYKWKLEEILKRKLWTIKELVVKNGIKINMIDALFLILPKNPRDINEESVKIIVWDFDNVQISRSNTWKFPYDEDYLAEKFIAVLK